MARHLLTALEIKNSTKAKLRDGDGLWLHRNKSGGRTWVFIYIRNGRRREMGLGSYGSGTGEVSLAAARAKTDEVRGILGRGGDPIDERRAERAASTPTTFKSVAEDYVKAMSSKWRGKATHDAWRRFVETYTKPIHRTVISAVEVRSVLKVLDPIWIEKPETGRKVRERLKLVLDYAKAKGLRTGDNPAEWKGHLDKILPEHGALQKGHHASMPYNDMSAFVAALRNVKGTGARALEFTLLTAARSGETRWSTWSEFDLDGKLWTVPAERMKSGIEHRVPLSDRAVEILREMQGKRVSDYVFPGAVRGSAISDMTMAKALRAAGGDGFTVHGFRSTFRDWAAEETDHQRETAEAALAHAVGDKTERAYRRGDALAKRRALMNDWAEFCISGK
jgi:integrase